LFAPRSCAKSSNLGLEKTAEPIYFFAGFMKSKLSLHVLPLIVAFCPTLATSVNAGIAFGLNTPLPIQNFDSPKLVKLGSALVGALETNTGWTFSETGDITANTTYAAQLGDGAAGDTWSFGAFNQDDRALGTLRGSTSLVSMFGASFTRSFVDASIIDIYVKITFTGEQWRLGATGVADRLDFEYSRNATSLTTGDWTDFNALDFNAPVTTGTANFQLDGNLAANQTAVSNSTTFTVPSVLNGQDFWIRWKDFDAVGTAEHGLAVDNFSMTVVPEPSTTTLFGALGLAMLLRRRR
jgi:hypothetical protein